MSDNVQDLFRQSMRRFATTVSVVSCSSGGQRYGITATAVASLSLDPASVIVCIGSKASLIRPLLCEAAFCVNFLQASQAEISTMFGGKAKGDERFLYGDWESDEAGRPYLVDAQANIFCRVDGSLSYGTHTAVIGRVERVLVGREIAPLVYQDGGYVATASLPRAADVRLSA